MARNKLAGQPRPDHVKEKISRSQEERWSRLRAQGLPNKKRCPKCGKIKASPKEFGWTKRTLKSGDVSWQPRSWCKECARKKARRYKAARKKAGKLAADQHRWYLARRRKLIQSKEGLDPGPILEWIDQQPLSGPELAKMAGLDPSVVHKWREGSQRASLDSVDRLLLAADQQDQLHVLYP